MRTSRARLALRPKDSIEIEVQPGFVQLKIYKGRRMTQAAIIPGNQWMKLLRWAVQPDHRPTGNTDPILVLAKQAKLDRQIKKEALSFRDAVSREKRRRRGTVFY